MSRFPFGLCVCTLIGLSGCANLFTQTVQRPTFVQQPGNQSSSPDLQKHQQASEREVFPQGYEPAETDQNETSPAEIDLGEPQQFPETGTGPITVQQSSPHQTISHGNSTEVWKVPFHSSAQRPIELTQSGRGSYRVLILGSIYGNEPESIELLEAVTRDAKAYSQSPSYSFLMIRTPNPDGLVEHIRTNHNGVDLNRNFPSTWFTAKPNRLTGPFPASEVETKNLMRILKEFQPHRVLHIRSSIGQRPFVILNEQLAHAADNIHLQSKIDIGTFSGQYKAGSLEEFVTLRIDAEMLTVLLPPKGFQQLSAKDVFQLATTNFDSSKPMKIEENEREEPVAIRKGNPSTTVPAKPVRSILEPDGEKGYVELLPPPPTGEPFNRASNTTIPRKPEFYELPPPPQ